MIGLRTALPTKNTLKSRQLKTSVKALSSSTASTKAAIRTLNDFAIASFDTVGSASNDTT